MNTAAPRRGAARPPGRRLAVIALAFCVGVAGAFQDAQAATFTVKNNCSYTVYPGIYPASLYSNGGWAMASGTTVTINVPSGSIGRLWGRTGCDSSSPAVCTSGSCGGSGLQCAGTTGVPNTSLFEWNLNANGTDWYDISYVDAIDSPIGVTVSNGACVSPSACSGSVISSCPGDLKSGNVCLSPCTKYNTDQYCCRGAYGTAATCLVSQWAASAQTYVSNVHSYCPHSYAFAYDESSGALQTCPTGASYAITFCPSGSPPDNSTSISTSAWYNVVNANSGKCVDASWGSTSNGTAILQYQCGSTSNQQWQFVPAGGGYYNVVPRYATWLTWDVSGGPSATGNNALIQLWGFAAGASGTNQQWMPVSLGGGRYKFVARHSGRCLDVPSASTADNVQLQQYDCNNTGAQSFSLVQVP
jgi:hypothetical protein